MLRSLVFVVLLCSCTTVNHDNRIFEPIPPTIHHVYFGEMIVKCYKYTPIWVMILGGFPMACAEWNVPKKQCDIYISKDAPDWMLEHELDHCKGLGH